MARLIKFRDKQAVITEAEWKNLLARFNHQNKTKRCKKIAERRFACRTCGHRIWSMADPNFECSAWFMIPIRCMVCSYVPPMGTCESCVFYVFNHAGKAGCIRLLLSIVRRRPTFLFDESKLIWLQEDDEFVKREFAKIYQEIRRLPKLKITERRSRKLAVSRKPRRKEFLWKGSFSEEPLVY